MKSGIRLVHRIVLVFVGLVLLLCLTACQESTGSKYERANKLLTEGKYTEAAAVFDEISTYGDASKMALYTKAINAAETGDYETAISTFSSLGDFKDCPMMIIYYKGRQNEDAVYDGMLIHGSKWFEAITIYESIPLFRDSKDRAENCRKAAYDQAIKSGDDGDASFAVTIMKELGSYSDAAQQVTYYQAVKLLKQDDYTGASETFGTIPGFRDANDRVRSTLEEGYKTAEAKVKAGELDEANTLFLNLGDYKDSAERAYKLYYDDGISRRENQDWDGARAAFAKSGGFDDSATQIKATYYEEGIAKQKAEDWDGAVIAFTNAGDYSDAETKVSETKYLYARHLMNSGDCDGAAAILAFMKGYKDVDDILKNNDNLAAAVAAQEAKYMPYRGKGNIVTFGTYPQTQESDQMPVEWIVLDYDEANHKALLLSLYGLDTMPYNNTRNDITWERCTLRSWLNGKFLDKAFSVDEQSAILTTVVDNSASQGYIDWNTDGGNNTEDRIFLLSYAEANRYLGVTYDDKNNMKSRVVPTAYALARHAWTSDSYSTSEGIMTGCWWLRSPGYIGSGAASVYADGALYSYTVNNESNVVRPAFWLDLSSLIL